MMVKPRTLNLEGRPQVGQIFSDDQIKARCLQRCQGRAPLLASVFFFCFSMFLFDFSGPRSGLEGILELLEIAEELLNPLRGISDYLIAL